MRHAIFLCLIALLSCLASARSSSAQRLACSTPRNDGDLNANDPGVVRGQDIFHRGSDEYPFETFSIASPNLTAPGKVCFRYEIENISDKTIAPAGNPSGDIKAFRWKDIGLSFVDVSRAHRVRRLKNEYTRFDAVTESNSDVAAFESANATTTALVTVEQAEQKGDKGGPKLPLYKLTDRFPTTANALAEAHIPPTPVRAVLRAVAGDLSSISDELLTGDTRLSVSSDIKDEGTFYLLQTYINVDAPADSDPALFAPALSSKSVISEPLSEGSIREFTNNILNDERKTLEGGRFISVSEVKTPENSDFPAFFIVNYPISLITKYGSICLAVSVFSAYPLNLDDGFCVRKP